MDGITLIRQVSFVLAIVGMVLNTYYFWTRKSNAYRWLKLAYAFNCFVIVFFYVVYFVDPKALPAWIPAANLMLMLVSIDVGAVVNLKVTQYIEKHAPNQPQDNNCQ